jgi:hypothetical protein
MNQRKLKYPEFNNDAGFAAARAERLTSLILARIIQPGLADVS